MYSKVGISKLSHSQIGKLLTGHGVRVYFQANGGHEVHLSAEQVKNLVKHKQKGQHLHLYLIHIKEIITNIYAEMVLNQF